MVDGGISKVRLRQEYQNIPFDVFLRITGGISVSTLDAEEMEILRLILNEENEKGKAAKAAWEGVVQERLQFLVASMIHHELDIDVPGDLDREYVQAYIVYGLIAPSSTRTFAGSRYISPQTIRGFVERKLGSFFNLDKHQKAEAWLVQQGVVDTAGGGYSLNLKENETGVTPVGLEIIIGAKRLMYKYRPTRRE